MIEVVNRQRRRPIPSERLREVASKALDALGSRDAGLTIAVVSDRAIRRLNDEFRSNNTVTDVLSFPAEQDDFEMSEGRVLGDVIISSDRAAEQAEQNDLDFDSEMAQLLLHGIIHLHGFDHTTDNGEMNALELRLRRKLGL
jgi:probable rRNA maturation factor